MTKFNRDMIQFFNKCRALGVNLIICLPDFMELDKGLFNIGIIDGLVRCNDVDTPGLTKFGVYDKEGMSWLRYRASQWPYHPHKPYQLVRPYLHGEFVNLSEERSRKLHELSTGQKIESITESQEDRRRERWKDTERETKRSSRTARKKSADSKKE